MCGISVFISKIDKNILRELLASLQQLQNRGYDSAGAAYVSSEEVRKINIIKYASTNTEDSLESLNKEITEKNISSTIAIGHTRWATHGGKTKANSHPHMSYNNKIVLVHNGIIENYLELKNFLKSNNYVFKSETDTEVIANLIEYYYLNCSTQALESNNRLENSIKTACNKMQGTWALAIMNADDLNSIYITRNGSPLLIGENENMLICTSEICGFCGNMNNYIRLENDNIIKIQNGKLETNIENIEIYEIEKDISAYTCDPYPHWTLKEIYEQPQSIMRAINNGARIADNKIKLGGMYCLMPFINNIDNIIFLACGTSLHACAVGKYYFHDNCEFDNISIYDAAEFQESFIPKCGKNLVIYCSQSGETRDLYKNIELCRKYDCINLGIINVVDSLITHEMHCGVYMNAGREVAVASTKSFTSSLVILSMISLLFSKKQIYNENNIQALRNLSSQLESMLNDNEFLTLCESIKENILNTLRESGNNSIFVLGKGKMFPIAKEAALKIKEITYIHAEGYSGGALKHGPFALLDDNSIVILFIDEKTQEAMINTYEEIRSRGAYCYIVSELDMDMYIGYTSLERNKTQVLNIVKNSYYQEILAIVAIQYISYLLAIAKDINPDKPRNLAKVVTVQ